MNRVEYERGPTHGQHTKHFYWIGALLVVVVGMIGGCLLKPEDWSMARSLIAGALTGLLSAYCVFAWHMLTDTIEER